MPEVGRVLVQADDPVDAAALGGEYITVLGRRGGRAITAAALHALAQAEEL